MSSPIQATGSNFDLNTYLKVRDKTINIVTDFADSLRIGMDEVEGHKLLDSIMNDYGVEKKWHPNKFRIASNTLKSFSEKSDEGIFLKEDDIFFVDIGPVLDGHEGDFGDTFVFGDNEQFKSLQKAVREIFKATSNAWKEKGLTGMELYKFASDYADKLGHKLNPKMDGHRLGDFPHALYFKGSLSEVEEKLLPNLWVLEILIQNKEGTHGAFYEDILY